MLACNRSGFLSPALACARTSAGAVTPKLVSREILLLENPLLISGQGELKIRSLGTRLCTIIQSCFIRNDYLCAVSPINPFLNWCEYHLAPSKYLLSLCDDVIFNWYQYRRLYNYTPWLPHPILDTLCICLQFQLSRGDAILLTSIITQAKKNPPIQSSISGQFLMLQGKVSIRTSGKCVCSGMMREDCNWYSERITVTIIKMIERVQWMHVSVNWASGNLLCLPNHILSGTDKLSASCEIYTLALQAQCFWVTEKSLPTRLSVERMWVSETWTFFLPLRGVGCPQSWWRSLILEHWGSLTRHLSLESPLLVSQCLVCPPSYES